MTEQRVRQALEHEASQVDPDVDDLWSGVQERLAVGDRRRARPWLPALAAAAVVTAVVGVGLATLDDGQQPSIPPEPAGSRSTGPTQAAPTATPTPTVIPTPADEYDPYRFVTTAKAPEPIDRSAVRRIDGNLVRGQVVLVDVRPGEPPGIPTRWIGTVFTYAYPCVGIDSPPVCLTSITVDGTIFIETETVSTDGLLIQPWQGPVRPDATEWLVAHAAPAGARSTTISYGLRPPKPATRITGQGWPFTLLVALGPPSGEITVEVELPGGRTRSLSARTDPTFTG